MKSVRIWSFSDPYTVRMLENTDTFHALQTFI